jgi:hypothetical protein
MIQETILIYLASSHDDDNDDGEICNEDETDHPQHRLAEFRDCDQREIRPNRVPLANPSVSWRSRFRAQVLI